MEKIKRQYLIFEQSVTTIPGDGVYKSEPVEVGTTYAVSEAQAINNYCYRTGRKPYRVIEGYADSATECFLHARPCTLEDIRKGTA